MKTKRTYHAVSVERFQLASCLGLLTMGCIVALDVAKQRFVAALATATGEVVGLFRFDHPTQTREFLRLVGVLVEKLGREKVCAAMEPTGTYGDAIRHQLVAMGVPVVMVSPKQTHDSQALFDNVRSLHDPKSAALVAKLCGMGLGQLWSPPSASVPRLRALVELRRHEQHKQEACFGRLEGVLARHWPESGRWLDIREQKSALCLLAVYPSPARIAAEPDGARALLVDASRGRLAAEVLDGVIDGARTTLGVPATPEEELFIRSMASDALEATRRMAEIEKRIAELAADDEAFERLQPWMGTYTAAVIVTHCDPRRYANARQIEKAAGLNLREKSSGEHHGRLMITKRGPGVVRHALYLFALRMIQSSPAVQAWYKRRRGYTEESKQRAVVAVMRKLVRALFHVARGSAFDPATLFDLRRLSLAEPASTPRGVTPRTTPRPIARGAQRARKQRTAATAAP
jgi:transposase